MRIFSVLLFGAVSGYIVNTSMFNTSMALTAYTTPLKVVFWDFDETLTIGQFGNHCIALCDINCVGYNTSRPCTCNASNVLGDFLVNNYSAAVLGGPDMLGINGTDRRDRLLQTFQTLTANGVQLKVLSTSWYSIGHDAWAYFLEKFFVVAGLDGYLNASNIIALDDPGACCAADKGSAAQLVLNNSGWTMHQGLLVDDSPSNIGKALCCGGRVDALEVTPRSGIAVDGLQWIESRSAQKTFTTPTPSSASSFAPGLFVALVVTVFYQ